MKTLNSFLVLAVFSGLLLGSVGGVLLMQGDAAGQALLYGLSNEDIANLLQVLLFMGIAGVLLSGGLITLLRILYAIFYQS